MIDLDPHKPLVLGAAQRLHRRLPKHIAIDELVQDGLIGLFQASRSFDPARSVTFATYAQRRIVGAMLDGLRDRDQFTRGARARGERAHRQVRSIHAATGQDDGDRVADTLANAQQAEMGTELGNAEQMRQLTADLPDERCRWLLRMRFEEDMTLLEIAEVLGVSKSRVSQMQTASLNFLRARLTAQANPTRCDMSKNGSNGNGTVAAATPLARTQQVVTHAPETMELPPWMQAIRDSVAGAIKGDDLQKIMAVQVKAAMDGDREAAKFVFDQARKFSEVKGLTINKTDNHFYGSGEAADRPNKPTKALPGTSTKVDLMRARLAAGEPLTRPDDAGGDGDENVDLS